MFPRLHARAYAGLTYLPIRSNQSRSLGVAQWVTADDSARPVQDSPAGGRSTLCKCKDSAAHAPGNARATTVISTPATRTDCRTAAHVEADVPRRAQRPFGDPVAHELAGTAGYARGGGPQLLVEQVVSSFIVPRCAGAGALGQASIVAADRDAAFSKGRND